MYETDGETIYINIEGVLNGISLQDAVNALNDLTSKLAEYKYTPKAYDVMWERVMELEKEIETMRHPNEVRGLQVMYAESVQESNHA